MQPIELFQLGASLEAPEFCHRREAFVKGWIGSGFRRQRCRPTGHRTGHVANRVYRRLDNIQATMGFFALFKKEDLMKQLLGLGILMVLFGAASIALADESVHGYYRKDGTYVAPHYRSSPDGNPYNNFSFPGNTNPYTGKVAPGNPDMYLDRYNNKPAPSSPFAPANPYRPYGR